MAQKETVGIFIDSKADLKGFKQAETAAQKLGKTVKNLAGAIGIAYGTDAVIAFGKASLKAFTEDQLAAVKLSKAVDNLGLSFANPAIDKFIISLEKSSGIVDETLRPAFQSLLTTTGSVTKSQQLLNDAINISRGSGVDLATTVDDLSKGYVGITKGLEKYKTGLTRAELKSKGFASVLQILKKEYSGASAAYLGTYAGKFDILSVAVDNAKEKIGRGLVDAFTQLSGGGSVTAATDSINIFAEAVAALEVGTGTAIGTLPLLFQKIKDAGKSFFYGFAATQFKVPINVNPVKEKPKTTAEKIKELLAKSEAAAQKRAADLAAATLKTTKALTAEQKKQAALKKDSGIFDMQQIELVAALKGELSADDRHRAELQLALLNGNLDEADKLTKQILMAQDATGNLYRYFLQTPEAKNPFGYLDKWILDFQNKLNALQFPGTSGGGGYTPATIDPAIAAIGVIAGGGGSNVADNQYSNTLLNGLYGMQTAGDSSLTAGGGSTQPIIYNYFGGSVVTDQQLLDQVMNGTQLASLSGSPSQIGRIAGMFG